MQRSLMKHSVYPSQGRRLSKDVLYVVDDSEDTQCSDHRQGPCKVRECTVTGPQARVGTGMGGWVIEESEKSWTPGGWFGLGVRRYICPESISL